MADVLIVLLGLMGTINGLEKTSAMSFKRGANGLMLAAILQVVGSTLSILCVATRDFTVPVIFIMASMLVWSMSDRRKRHVGVL